MRVSIVSLLVAVTVTAPVNGQEPLEVIAWNVESDGSDMDSVAQEVRAFSGVHLWGFSEVPAWAKSELQRGAGIGEGAFYDGVLGSTGGNDRLLVVYNTERLTPTHTEELHSINDANLNHRSPLVVHFQDNDTGREFLFMVNHLARKKAWLRHQQATQLNDWIRAQTLPVIAVGDFNFDWDVQSGDQNHDEGYDNLIADDVWKWVRPPTLVRTQCTLDTTTGQCTYDSVLDFVFVANDAGAWAPSSEIVIRPNDFPDNQYTADHRPVRAQFTVGAPPAASTLREQVLAEIDEIRSRLAELEALANTIQD